VVDDAAFYGSAGLGHTNDVAAHTGILGVQLEVMRPISDESNLNLSDGHAYVMSAPATGYPAIRNSGRSRCRPRATSGQFGRGALDSSVRYG
jgi:hypothetical protein